MLPLLKALTANLIFIHILICDRRACFKKKIACMQTITEIGPTDKGFLKTTLIRSSKQANDTIMSATILPHADMYCFFTILNVSLTNNVQYKTILMYLDT